MIVSVNSGRRMLFVVFLVTIPDTVSNKDAKSTVFSSGIKLLLVFRPAPLYTKGDVNRNTRLDFNFSNVSLVRLYPERV